MLDKALTLVELDELIDRANRNATEDVLSLGDSAEEREYGLRMLVVSRCVERIGDHAVDIGEQVVYLVTGEFREFSDASHPPADASRLRRRAGAAARRGARDTQAARAKASRRRPPPPSRTGASTSSPRGARRDGSRRSPRSAALRPRPSRTACRG